MTRYYEKKLFEINNKISKHPEKLELLYIKAECLVFLQKYESAWRLYKKITNHPEKLSNYKSEILRDVGHNMNYCIKPLPWTLAGPLDMDGSYIHYVLLKNFGNPFIKSSQNLE